MPLKYRIKNRVTLQYETVDGQPAGDLLSQTPALRKVLTVTELTRDIKRALEGGFSSFWVEGEVSNFKFHTSGHMYFSLKDENAQISCVMFRHKNMSLGFEPKDGMQVVSFGALSVYEVRGQYQFYAERMEPKGVGALQVRFQQLKEKLKLEGLFDEGRKRALPFLPKRIAVVTSVDGAALRDILHVLNRRFSHAHILIYPVAVQGAAAAPAIAEAIDDLNREQIADVMIVGRGGGSLEDLWAFNEEIVARAIFNSGIPVISAVGHETDFTVADFVADFRAPTPSAAAEIVLPLLEDLIAAVEDRKSRLVCSVMDMMKEKRENLKRLSDSRALKDPLAVFEALFQRLDELSKNLTTGFGHFLSSRRDEAAILMGKLEVMGPLATLKRGFSISLAHPDGGLIRSVKDVKSGDTVKTKLKDGYFLSRVTEAKNGG